MADKKNNRRRKPRKESKKSKTKRSYKKGRKVRPQDPATNSLRIQYTHAASRGQKVGTLLRFAKVVGNSIVLPYRFRPFSGGSPSSSRFVNNGMKRLRDLASGKISHDSVTKEQWAVALQHIEATASRSLESGAVSGTNAAGVAGSGLSECAALYAKAIANPFGSFDTLPCVPCSPPIPTQRWRSFTRTAMQSGTQGYGWVVVKPFVASFDLAKLYTTQATLFVGTGSTAINYAAAGVQGAADPTLPYTNNQMTSGMSGRLVGLGVRVKNTTQASNISGALFACLLADNDNASNYTPLQIIALPQTIMIANYDEADQKALSLGEESGTWRTLLWRPSEMLSTDFQPDDGTAQNLNGTVVIISQAPAGVVQSYTVEMVEFWEYQGVAIVGGTASTTPDTELSHADTVGMDRVLQAAQRMPASLDANEWVEQMAVGTVDAMAHSDSAARTVEDLVGLSGLNGGLVNGLVHTLISFLAA